jgi:hypothetical protein
MFSSLSTPGPHHRQCFASVDPTTFKQARVSTGHKETFDLMSENCAVTLKPLSAYAGMISEFASNPLAHRAVSSRIAASISPGDLLPPRHRDHSIDSGQIGSLQIA